MDKRTQKKPNYNQDIIKRLKEKFGVSSRFITASLSGDRKSETSDTIKKQYASMSKAVTEFIKTL